MRLTLNIDDALLTAAMEATGARSKTEAIHYALREVSRRHRLLALATEGLGMSSEEIRGIYRPDFSWEAMRDTRMPDLRCAEDPAPSSSPAGM